MYVGTQRPHQRAIFLRLLPPLLVTTSISAIFIWMDAWSLAPKRWWLTEHFCAVCRSIDLLVLYIKASLLRVQRECTPQTLL